MKKRSGALVMRDVQIKTIMKLDYTPIKMAKKKKKKSKNIPQSSTSKDLKQLEYS